VGWVWLDAPLGLLERSAVNRAVRNRIVVLSSLLALAVLGVAIVPWVGVRYGLGFVLLWILPGLAWGALLLREALPPVARTCVALGLNFVLTPITILGLSYLPGPVSRWQILLATAALGGLPLLLMALQAARDGNGACAGTQARPVDIELSQWLRQYGWLAVVLLCLVAGLRLTNLGYSEFQGDEATVLVRAAELLEGDSQAIFHHKKGPAEILIVAGVWRLTGITNEWMARLPFSWASVLAVVAACLVGRTVYSLWVGIIAAPLLAIEGYLLAFGRITQYQSLITSLGILGLFCLLQFYQTTQPVLVVCSAMLMAAAALAHYDAIFVLPPALFVLAVALWRRRRQFRGWAIIALAAILGGAMLASFYWPFMVRTASGTVDYVSSRIGSGVRNNLASVFTLSAVYDSVYMLALLVLGVWVQVWCAWRRYGWGGVAAVGMLSGWALTAFVRSAMGWHVAAGLAALPFAFLLVGALMGPRQSVLRRALWFWLLFPVVFYLFYVETAWTHVQTFMPPAILLTAASIWDVRGRLRGSSRIVRWLAIGAGAALWLVCGYYAVLMFVQHSPEYRRTFPEHKLSLYWTPYEKMPRAGLFGFPYRAGWKAVGYLIETGQLTGDYESNEEPSVLNYYLRTASRWHCPTPDMYVTAVNVQDEIYIRWDQVADPYRPWALVTVEGEPKIAIHRLDAVGEAPWLPVEDYAWQYDLMTTPARLAQVDLTFPEIPEPTMDTITEVNVRVGEHVRLIGYDLPTTEVVVGNYLSLTLVWEALSSEVPDYAIFAHVQGDGYLWGQMDGLPACGEESTASWGLEPRSPIVDLFRVPIRVETPPGTYPLRVGMYDRMSLARLPVVGPEGEALGDGAHLVDITVRAP
jgi:hypothetical protein